MRRPGPMIAAGGVIAVITVVVAGAVIVSKTSDDDSTPGWDETDELDTISVSRDLGAVGVGNREVSLVSATGRVGDGLQRGVAVTDRATGDVSFVRLTDGDASCYDNLDITVGPAGFVYRALESYYPCSDTASGFAAVSADGVDWETVSETTEFDRLAVFSGQDRFLGFDDGNLVDAVTGDELSPVPWNDDFSVWFASGSTEGEVAVFGLGEQDALGWAMSPQGEWAPIRTPIELLDPDLQFELVNLRPRLQSTDHGGFRLLSGVDVESMALESDDGITWNVVDTGIHGDVLRPDTEVLYTSPARTLVELENDVTRDSAALCFAMTGQCEIPEQFLLEFGDGVVDEVIADDDVLRRGVISGVDDDGLYTVLRERDGERDDGGVDVLRMSDRNIGTSRTRFDRRPLDLAFCPDEIGADPVDMFAEVVDDGASLELRCVEGALTRSDGGGANTDELRRQTIYGYRPEDPAEYAMFTAVRDDDDRIIVSVYPTDEVYGIYEVVAGPSDAGD